MDPSLTNAAWHARPHYRSHERSPNGLKQLAAVALAIVVLVPAGSSLYRTLWDPRMGAEAAGRALSALVHNGGVYVCRPIENDGTIPLDDVDYACGAVNKPILSGYWIGTDGDSITEVEPNG